MIRKLIKDKDYISIILNIEYLKELYSFTKSQNFLILKEVWNILFYIYESKKVESTFVENFMSEKANEIVETTKFYYNYPGNVKEVSKLSSTQVGNLLVQNGATTNGSIYNVNINGTKYG